MTYFVLNLFFLLTLLMFIPKKIHRPARAWWTTLVIILALTAIFDPLIIAAHIVEYDPSKILGIRWFGAPIEDFFYAVYAVCLVPLVWIRLEERGV
jgi:lycopene cyclase domain-containing protein